MAHRESGAIDTYPELPACPRPATERVLEIFADITRHDQLQRDATPVPSFEAELSCIERQHLDLLGVPTNGYTARS